MKLVEFERLDRLPVSSNLILVIARTLKQDHASCLDFKEKGQATLIAIVMQLNNTLQGKTSNPLEICGKHFDEHKDLATSVDTFDPNDKKAANDLLLAKILLYFVHEQHARVISLMKLFLKKARRRQVSRPYFSCTTSFVPYTTTTPLERKMPRRRPLHEHGSVSFCATVWKHLNREYSSINQSKPS